MLILRFAGKPAESCIDFFIFQLGDFFKLFDTKGFCAA